MRIDDLMLRRVGSWRRLWLFLLPAVVAYVGTIASELVGAEQIRHYIRIASLFLFFGYMGVLIVLVGLRFLESFSYRAYGSGCCEFCGYDLRASPERCPECGEPVRPGP
jgi:hypothetical protein